MGRKVSEAVIRRLPRYYRRLLRLNNSGIKKISSRKLAEQMGLSASQIRQDFNCFGGFGQQGYGYNVESLLANIKAILGIDAVHNTIIVGVGNIGRALANFEGFASRGFILCGLFDISPELIGSEIGGLTIRHPDELADFIVDNNVSVGIIAARSTYAQMIADNMVAAGVSGIWNFAPIDVTAPVPVENVHMNDSLYVLSYRLTHDFDDVPVEKETEED